MKYYYTLKNVNTVDFIPYVKDSNYSGISMTKLTGPRYKQYTNGQITFVGYRLKAKKPFNVAKYNETATLQTKDGMVVASLTYDDKGDGFATTVDSLDYMIHNGTESFAGKKIMRITFDNKSIPKKRMIEILP